VDTILPQVLSFTQKLVSYPCAEMGQQRQRAAQMFGRNVPAPNLQLPLQMRCVAKAEYRAAWCQDGGQVGTTPQQKLQQRHPERQPSPVPPPLGPRGCSQCLATES